MRGETFFGAVLGTAWEEVVPLARLLEVTLEPEASSVTRAHCQALWKELSYLGSNDLAYLLRGFEGVDYPEIVRDVCKHLRVRELRPGDDAAAVEQNEQLVIQKLFEGAWERLDAGERRELLRELNLDEAHLPLGGAAVATAVLAGTAGGFAIYQLTAVVANWVARALLGRGLALGTNAALARVLGVALGPVGWVASGAWLLSDVTSPAKRKTVPAVVLVASLRQAKRAALAETAFADAEQLAERFGLPAAVAAGPKQRKRLAKKRAAKKRAAKKKTTQRKAPIKPRAKRATPAKKQKKKASTKARRRPGSR